MNIEFGSFSNTDCSGVFKVEIQMDKSVCDTKIENCDDDENVSQISEGAVYFNNFLMGQI